MKVSHGEKMAWPPIIDGANKSIFLKLRDMAMLLIGWAIFGFLMQDALILVYEYLKPPTFVMMPEDIPNWLKDWALLRPFVLVSGSLVVGIVVVGVWRRKIIRRTIDHYYLTPEDEADLIYRESGVLPSDVQEWHRLRDVDAHLDAEGDIKKVVNRESVCGDI